MLTTHSDDLFCRLVCSPPCKKQKQKRSLYLRLGKRRRMDVDLDYDTEQALSYSLRAAALSPPPPCVINKLPAELLNDIFHYTLPSIPSFHALDSPLMLTHVCHGWRAIALAQSNLWETLYLPSPVEGLTEGIIQLCSLWLQRSRARPLSVDFHLASDYQPWKITSEHVKGVQRIVKLLAPHAHRISKLLRIFPRFLLDDLKLEDMTILDDLFICDTADGAAGRTQVAPRSFTTPARLRCLSLRQTFFDVRAFNSLGRIAHLDLWQLQGDGQMSITSALSLLRELHWLESCTLDVAHGDAPAASTLRVGDIRMPSLTFLFISWDWLVDVGPVLDSLHTPALRRLGLRGPPPTRRAWPHLRRYLRRCAPPLTQLSIKEIGFTDIQLLDCLRLTPQLTNLSLSHCSVDSAFVRALRLDPRACAMALAAEMAAAETVQSSIQSQLITPLSTPPLCGRTSEQPMLVDTPSPPPSYASLYAAPGSSESTPPSASASRAPLGVLPGTILPALEFLSLEACDDFDVKDLVAMLHTRGARAGAHLSTGSSSSTTSSASTGHAHTRERTRTQTQTQLIGPRRLRGIRLSFCRRVLEAHRVELENSGVENVIIRVNRAARHPAR